MLTSAQLETKKFSDFGKKGLDCDFDLFIEVP